MNKKKTSKKTTKTIKPENIHQGRQLTLDRAKLIVSYYIANNCSNKTEALIKAGYSSKTATYNSTRIFNDSRIQEELKRQITPVVAQSQITLINLQNKLNAIADKIIAADDLKLYPTAISAINSLLKTIGGFQADRQPPENLAAKLLETKKAEELNKALNAYYSNKYLACEPGVKHIESECKDSEGMSNVNTLQPDSASFEPNETIEQEKTGQEAITPQPHPASTTYSPSLTSDDFSEKRTGDIGKYVGIDNNGDMVEYSISSGSQDIRDDGFSDNDVNSLQGDNNGNE